MRIDLLIWHQIHRANENRWSLDQESVDSQTTIKSQLRQTTNFATSYIIFEKIRYDISWELSASRQFSWNIMPSLLFFLEKQQNLKLSSAANCRWRFMGKTDMRMYSMSVEAYVSEPFSICAFCVCEKYMVLWYCAHAHSRLSIVCSPMLPHVLVKMLLGRSQISITILCINDCILTGLQIRVCNWN